MQKFTDSSFLNVNILIFSDYKVIYLFIFWLKQAVRSLQGLSIDTVLLCFDILQAKWQTNVENNEQDKW